MNKDKIKEYCELKQKVKALESELDVLQPQVLEFMTSNELEELEIDGVGKISKASRRKWTYSPDIQDMESNLKAKKKEAEQIGEAQYVEKAYILFKANKDAE